MAADAIVYCLESLTDYFQFERLCHDLMIVEGYKGLEPLGGWQDKGRDAIHVSKLPGSETTIFAYSVREDWFVKLKEDAAKVHNYRHECDNFVFACTSFIPATERDNAISYIKKEYGWELHLYGIERIRANLSANQQIIANHPQIFSPPFFTVTGGLSLVFSPEYIVVDYSEDDEVISTWITRKLKLYGYKVWCRAIDPIAGESINDTTQSLIETCAFVYVPILSEYAIRDTDFTFRRNIAYKAGSSRNAAFVIPIVANAIDDSQIDTKLRELEKIRFDDGWQSGLAKIIQRMESLRCPKSTGGISCALNSFFPINIISNNKETIISNIFPVLNVPGGISRYISKENLLSEEISDMEVVWAFRAVNSNTFLSFHPPPQDIEKKYKIKRAGGEAWRYIDYIENISSQNLTSELIKKSLKIVCGKQGLAFCPETKGYYFPLGLLKSNRISVKRHDGRSISISAIGERTYYKSGISEKYRYHISPAFYVKRLKDMDFYVIVRIHFRLTDLNGNLLDGQKRNSRRKHLCKDMWNNDWLSRVLGVMQYLGDGEKIEAGSEENKIVSFGVNPVCWELPISINEHALSDKVYSRDYLNLESMEFEDDSDDTDSDDE